MVNLLGGTEAASRARSPQIMAEAAMAVLKLPGDRTGQTFIDVDILAEAGTTDLEPYGAGDRPELDFFVDPR